MPDPIDSPESHGIVASGTYQTGAYPRMLTEQYGSGLSASVAGSATNPGAGANVVATATLPPGVYEVRLRIVLAGTLAAADRNNLKLIHGSTLVTNLINTPVADAIQDYFLPRVTVGSGGVGEVLAVAAIGAASGASAVYHAQIIATLVA